jgi:hypothetical protein
MTDQDKSDEVKWFDSEGRETTFVKGRYFSYVQDNPLYVEVGAPRLDFLHQEDGSTIVIETRPTKAD